MGIFKFFSQMDVSPILAKMMEHVPLTKALEAGSALCNFIDFCCQNYCENSGRYVDEADGSRCECSPGFYGSECEEPDDCYPDPCFNGATCTDGNGEYSCSCTPGYYGTNCEEPDECFSNPWFHGNCTDGSDGFACACSPGFVGLTCELIGMTS